MNTESSQENTSTMTTGERLRQAREKLGLSHQVVAERLCLKVSTIRQIEDETTPSDLAPTFLRGYIRSYAKLVQVSEDELSSMIGKQAPIKVPKVASMQGFSLGKSRKKRDGWLMGFTWLVVFVVIGLTGAWWWQNHQAQQEEIVNMADQSTAKLNQNSAQGQSIPLGNNDGATGIDFVNTAPVNNIEPELSIDTPAVAGTSNQAANTVPLNSDPLSTAATANAPVDTQIPTLVTPSDPLNSITSLPIGNAQSGSLTEEAGAIAMTFKADCWLQVDDASGKTLFSGMKKGGETLNVKGTAPYKLKIGAPAAVDIQYQGKPVDLSSFIKSSRVARLTLSAE